jgi:hypothetical protein
MTMKRRKLFNSMLIYLSTILNRLNFRTLICLLHSICIIGIEVSLAALSVLSTRISSIPPNLQIAFLDVLVVAAT